MTFYFLGSEMTSYSPSDASTTDGFATANYSNSSFVRGAMYVGRQEDTQYAASPTIALPDTFYCRFDYRQHQNGGDTTVVEFRDGSAGLLRLNSTGDSFQLQAKIGGVWTNVGSAVSYSSTTVQTVDIYCEGNDATGTAALFLSGTERTSATVNLSAVTGITSLRHYGIEGIAANVISQFIAADEPTIGMRLATYYPNGAGATGDWTGTYTGVDENTYSDSDFIYSDTNGQVELFTGTGPALTGYVVRAVGVYARAKRGAGGPQNLQLALRANGTNYFSGSKALGVGYAPYGHIWETNPDTTADWLTSEIATLQFGVKAVT